MKKCSSIFNQWKDSAVILVYILIVFGGLATIQFIRYILDPLIPTANRYVIDIIFYIIAITYAAVTAYTNGAIHKLLVSVVDKDYTKLRPEYREEITTVIMDIYETMQKSPNEEEGLSHVQNKYGRTLLVPVSILHALLDENKSAMYFVGNTVEKLEAILNAHTASISPRKNVKLAVRN